MTPGQLTTLKNAIAADQTMNAFPNNVDGNRALAEYLNTVPESPSMIWKPSVSVPEMNSVIDWAAFSALTVAKQVTYQAMTQGGSVDATSSSVRGGFVTVFGNPSTTLTALTTLAQRAATRAEAIFTTGNVCALFGLSVSGSEVAQARNS